MEREGGGREREKGKGEGRERRHYIAVDGKNVLQIGHQDDKLTLSYIEFKVNVRRC